MKKKKWKSYKKIKYKNEAIKIVVVNCDVKKLMWMYNKIFTLFSEKFSIWGFFSSSSFKSKLVYIL